MLMLDLDQLMMIQGVAALVCLLFLGGGTIYLLAGLIRPTWVRRTKRRWVVATTLALWLLGIGTYFGAVAFTHSHPNGPHAFKGYWERYIEELCAEGEDIPGCHEQAPAAADPSQAPPETSPR
jgi:hypothetical protein